MYFFLFLEWWARNSICLCRWSGQVVVDEGARIVDSDSPWRVRWTPLTALERAPALVSQQISRYGQQGVPPSWPEPSLAALPCSLSLRVSWSSSISSRSFVYVPLFPPLVAVSQYLLYLIKLNKLFNRALLTSVSNCQPWIRMVLLNS